MKTFKNLLFILLAVSLLFACSKPNVNLPDEMINDENSTENLKCGHNGHHGLDQDRYVYMKNVGLKVHYRIIGKGPVDIVFIPGWTNPLTVYSKQFDFFRDKARCIYIDLPGHGLSDAPENMEYTMELMADAIYAIVKKEGVHHFIGVGFSWGHTPLTQFEKKHPGKISQLILLDIGIETWPPNNEEIRYASYIEMLGWTKEVKAELLQYLIPPETAPADLIEWGQYFPEFPSSILANMNYHFLAEEACQPYPWKIPSLVIYNKMKEAKELKTMTYFPGCEIHVLGGDQHIIQWAYADTVNELMDEFIIYRHCRKH